MAGNGFIFLLDLIFWPYKIKCSEKETVWNGIHLFLLIFYFNKQSFLKLKHTRVGIRWPFLHLHNLFLALSCLFSAIETLEQMAERNSTKVTEFILLGFSVPRNIEIILFLLLLVVYTLTLVGNIGMISLIRLDARLHTPMYFFLSHLAFVDLCYSSSIALKLLDTLLTEHRSISFYACATQLGFFLNFLISEMFLLAVMAYDRYVAICNPLLYTVIMSQKLCMQLVTGPYLYSFSVALLHTVVTFQLTYCGPNIINHFYCDDVPLMALACSDTSLKEILIFIFAGFNMISSLMTVLISYIYIVAAILRIQSTEGRYKAFSTCASHLTTVTIFYGTLIFMYLQPKSNHSLDTDKMASVFYTIVIPMLNPMIYSLRNQEVKSALRKAIDKCHIFSLTNFKKWFGTTLDLE